MEQCRSLLLNRVDGKHRVLTKKEREVRERERHKSKQTIYVFARKKVHIFTMWSFRQTAKWLISLANLSVCVKYANSTFFCRFFPLLLKSTLESFVGSCFFCTRFIWLMKFVSLTMRGDKYWQMNIEHSKASLAENEVTLFQLILSIWNCGKYDFDFNLMFGLCSLRKGTMK